MNILKVYPFPDVKAGTEISMHLSSDALQAMGHQVFLLHGMPEPPATAAAYRDSIGLPPLFDRRSKVTPKNFSESLLRADEFCRKRQIEVVHLHTYPRTDAIAHFSRAVPTVVSVHVPLCPNGARYFWAERRVCDRKVGLGCLTTGYRCKGCGHLGNGVPISIQAFVRSMAEDHLLRNALKNCSQVITNSAWMQEKLIADSFAAKNLHIVHEPIVVGVDEGERLPENPPTITFIGRLVDFKGPDHLLKASAQITAPHRLWFIGGGAMQTELEKMASALGLSERVTFFGTLPPDEIAEYRRRSAIIVVPSLWPEPFGMVGPEAMLMRRPVVAYRVGGIPEWLEDGVTGKLVEPGNIEAFAGALAALFADPQQALDMGRAGAKAAVRWKPQAHAECLVGIYQKAMAEKGEQSV